MKEIETVQRRSVDCLDVALLIGHCLKARLGIEPFIGGIALDRHDIGTNRACCLLLLSQATKRMLNEQLGYDVHYFESRDKNACLVVVDVLAGKDIGRVGTKNHQPIELRKLRDYSFADMPITSTTEKRRKPCSLGKTSCCKG